MIPDTVIRDEPFPVRLDLDDFRGGWTCLAFFPPGMTSHPELGSFERFRGAFADEDCLLLAASIDPLWLLRNGPASFPLVADTNGLLAVSYGALTDGEPRFGWLLIDPSGRALRGRPPLPLAS